MIEWVCAWHKMITLMRRWQRVSENLDALRVYVFVFAFKHFEMNTNAMAEQCIHMMIYIHPDRFTCSTQHSDRMSERKMGGRTSVNCCKNVRSKKMMWKKKVKGDHLKISSRFCQFGAITVDAQKMHGKIEFRTNLLHVRFWKQGKKCRNLNTLSYITLHNLHSIQFQFVYIYETGSETDSLTTMTTMTTATKCWAWSDFLPVAAVWWCCCHYARTFACMCDVEPYNKLI